MTIIEDKAGHETGEEYGRRLVLNIIEERAYSNPHKVFATIPQTDNIDDGFVDVSYSRLLNAVHRASWWLYEAMGHGRSNEVFAYLGPNDLRYPILLLAAMRCQYQMLMPSPRNPVEFQAELFAKADCHTVFCSNDFTRRLAPLFSELSVVSEVCPDLWELLDSTPISAFPGALVYEEIQNTPFMILHTSGSTGPPKPIQFTHECITTEDAHRLLPDPDKTLWWHLFAETTYFVGLPLFHSAGIWFALFLPVYYDSHIVMGVGNSPTTAAGALHILKQRDELKGGIYPPSVLEEMSHDPELSTAVQHLDFLAYGGGPLSKQAGNTLSRLLTLHNFIGFTEASAPPRYIMSDPDDWNYFHFHAASGFKAEPIHDDLYRLVFQRRQEFEKYQSAFRLFSHLKSYAPGDILSPHPTKPNLWTHAGREDDLIVLATGEKFNPCPMELTIRSCPLVKDVLVVGDGQSQAMLLVERASENLSDDEVIRSLWPYVETANRQVATQGRILRHRIVVIPLENAFVRAGKGTVQRKRTVDELAVLIQKPPAILNTPLLATDHSEDARSTSPSSQSGTDTSTTGTQPTTRSSSPESPGNESSSSLLTGPSLNAVHAIVRDVFPDIHFDDNTSFTELGLDSIQAAQISGDLQRLIPGNSSAAAHLTVEAIYRASSVRELARYFNEATFVASQARAGLEASTPVQAISNQLDTFGTNVLDAVHAEDYIRKFTSNLPSQAADASTTFAITGARGSVGRQLVRLLSASAHVRKIYCLDRTEHQGQPIDKVERLIIDLSDSHLGLPKDKYAELAASVDVLIHGAWELNFLQPTKYFEKYHLSGVRHLVDLALSSHARLVFLSSIASGLHSHTRDGTIPEAVDINDDKRPYQWQNGYGQSKYIAERIIHDACQHTSLCATVVRLGQIGGCSDRTLTDASWNRSDWLPQIVSTSQSLGVLPLSLGAADQIDWVAVDKAAEVIIDLALHDFETANRGCNVYNLSNPKTTSWAALLPAISYGLRSRSDSRDDLKLIPLHRWIEILRAKSREKGVDVRQFPAVRIVDWLAGLNGSALPVLAHEEACKTSATLRSMQPISGLMVERWLKDWTL